MNKKQVSHPGIILQTQWLSPMKLSQNHVAIEMGVPARRINEIVLGKRAITADTALRLGCFFGTPPRFWLNLQMEYNIEKQKQKNGEKIMKQVRPINLLNWFN